VAVVVIVPMSMVVIVAVVVVVAVIVVVIVMMMIVVPVSVIVLALLGVDVIVVASLEFGLHRAGFLPDGDRAQDHESENADPAVEHGVVEARREEAEAIGAIHLDRREADEPAHEDGQQLLREVIAGGFAVVMMVIVSHCRPSRDCPPIQPDNPVQ
jgi:hypothetical protein